MRRFSTLALAGLVALMTLASDAEAGLFRKRVRVAAGQCQAAPAPTVAYRVAATTTTTASYQVYGDPLAAVNAVRARRGLHALAHDAALASAAASNNAAQAARGLGHFVTGGGAQCAAQASDGVTAAVMWERSPPHARIMLSPTARCAGAACGYGYSTLNVR